MQGAPGEEAGESATARSPARLSAIPAGDVTPTLFLPSSALFQIPTACPTLSRGRFLAAWPAPALQPRAAGLRAGRAADRADTRRTVYRLVEHGGLGVRNIPRPWRILQRRQVTATNMSSPCVSLRVQQSGVWVAFRSRAVTGCEVSGIPFGLRATRCCCGILEEVVPAPTAKPMNNSAVTRLAPGCSRRRRRQLRPAASGARSMRERSRAGQERRTEKATQDAGSAA